MKPMLKINGHDYTEYLAVDGLKPSANDLDKEGAGRNLLNGKMYRKRLGVWDKWTVSFNRISAEVLVQLRADMNRAFVDVTLLDPATNNYSTKSYYSATINEGIQRYVEGETKYDGVTFDITER